MKPGQIREERIGKTLLYVQVPDPSHIGLDHSVSQSLAGRLCNELTQYILLCGHRRLACHRAEIQEPPLTTIVHLVCGLGKAFYEERLNKAIWSTL